MPIQDNIYTSAKNYLYDVTTEGAYELDAKVDNLIESNKAESIVSLYMFPKEMAEGNQKTVTLNFPLTIHGYTPNNNKLFTFPYFFVAIDTMNDTKEYRREWFHDKNTCKVKLESCIVGNPEIMVSPLDYNGSKRTNYQDTPNPLESVVCNDFPQCAIAISAYKQYLAQKSLTNGLTAIGLGLGSMAQLATGNIVGGTLGAIGLAGVAANTAVTMSKGSKSRGTNAGGVETAHQYKTVYAKYISLTLEQALVIDEFFDRYGYAINRVTTPNISGRPLWNYVKTRDLTVGGSIPQDVRRKISDIYNNGVTLWKCVAPNKFGNYTDGAGNKIPDSEQ